MMKNLNLNDLIVRLGMKESLGIVLTVIFIILIFKFAGTLIGLISLIAGIGVWLTWWNKQNETLGKNNKN